jgi:hypothetical protein
MRPGPATQAASFVDLSSCLPAARGRGSMVPVRKRSLGVPHLPVLAAEWWFVEPLRCNPAVTGGQPAQRAGCRGGRNARATGCAHALFQFPPAIHPRELPAATSVTAIIVRQALKIATYSLNPLCDGLLRLATKKRSGVVQKLWRIRLRCGRLRKTKEDSISEARRNVNIQ